MHTFQNAAAVFDLLALALVKRAQFHKLAEVSSSVLSSKVIPPLFDVECHNVTGVIMRVMGPLANRNMKARSTTFGVEVEN